MRFALRASFFAPTPSRACAARSPLHAHCNARFNAPRRPGVLVLINGCDWELSGSLDAELAPGDAVAFISTLHGG